MRASTNLPTSNDATRHYTGPDAWEIAQQLPQRVRFERGWFQTAAVCHDSLDDGLSFRQRPDGGAIDVRCHSGRCSRERIVRRFEELTGQSIWSAYADARGSSTLAARPVKRRSTQPITGLVLVALLAAAALPILLGFDLQVIALNAVGLCWAGWFVRRIILNHRAALAKATRRR